MSAFKLYRDNCLTQADNPDPHSAEQMMIVIFAGFPSTCEQGGQAH